MDVFFATDPELVSEFSSQGFYDHIVVGSGIGGGILALELAKQNKNVLLIEKGNLEFHTHVLNNARPHSAYGGGASQDNNIVFAAVKQKIQTTPDSERYVGGPVYSLGGRSTLWSLWIPQVDKDTLSDYFPSEITDYLHSVGYKSAFDLLTNNSQTEEIYPKSQLDPQLLSRTTEQLDCAISRWRVDGYQSQLAPVATELISPSPYIFPMGAYSTVDALIKRMYDRDKNLTVLMGSEVLRVHHNGLTGSEPASVESLTIRKMPDRRVFHIQTQGAKVILCAGTIGTASIALNSGLQVANPLVGKGLMDHQIWGGRFAKKILVGHQRRIPPIKLQCLVHICRRRALLNVVINIDNFFARGSHGSHVSPAMQLFDHEDSLIECVPSFPLHGIRETDLDEVYVELEYSEALSDSNEVTNTPSSYPTIRIQRPMDLMTEDNQAEMQMLATNIRNTVLTTSLPNIDSILAPRLNRGGFGVVAHEVGTMRMQGPKTSQGVVDAHLKVHGFKDLHVCDLSVFPVSPPANPSLTLAALSLRLAEHLGSSTQVV